MTEAYIVAGLRTPVGKAGKGNLRFARPDDLAADVVRQLVRSVPALDPARINDIIIGCAMPEAEQGFNMGRMVSLLADLPISVPGMTVNRFCASGLETIAIAVAKIRAGMADVVIAGGAESMSLVPMGGFKIAPNPKLVDTIPNYYLGMGLTAELVQAKYGISREDQDQFAFQSHQKALAAIQSGVFNAELVPITLERTWLNDKGKLAKETLTVQTDEGPRADTTPERLAQLKPVFLTGGTVTAGNSSQTSDGAAAVLIVSEKVVKELNLTPVARLVSYQVAGVHPEIMGIGPVEAIPLATRQAGLSIQDIGLTELNEAFAAQSLAVIRQAGLNPDTVNVNGGAIALGHPLGCTGTKLSVQLINEMKRRSVKYGMVTACVGGGQGVAGIFERLG
ncbi:MAG: acetyl-CoA C-acyltransferase [Bacteroidetes bacterium]|nr:acetyl-CoA C-acyltransferase [Bacteroidota bacterium]